MRECEIAHLEDSWHSVRVSRHARGYDTKRLVIGREIAFAELAK